MKRIDSQNRTLGLVSEKVEKGDLICILYGCTVPVILRKGKWKTPVERQKEELEDAAETMRGDVDNSSEDASEKSVKEDESDESDESDEEDEELGKEDGEEEVNEDSDEDSQDESEEDAEVKTGQQAEKSQNGESSKHQDDKSLPRPPLERIGTEKICV